MKILYFSQLFTHTAGGGERVFREYAKYFSEHGDEISVVCQLSNFVSSKYSDIKIFPISPHVSGFLPTTADSFIFFLKGLLKGFQIISNKKIQLIHSNNFLPMLVGSVISKIAGIPHIATLHHVFTTSRMKVTQPVNSSVFSLGLITSVKQAFLSVSLKLAHPRLILVPSKKSLDDIRFLGYKGRVAIVPNGVALPELKTVRNTNQNSLKPYFLFLGRHIFYKNLDPVIKAFKIVTSKNPEAKFIVAGDGPMCYKWKSLVKDLNLEKNVQFVGFISEKEKEVLLMNCTALIFPSVIEGFGLTILEALAMAKPVLVADIEPINELVKPESDGYTVGNYYDEHEWAEKIFSLLNSPKKTEEMGQNGRQKVVDNYLEIGIFQRIQALYKQNLKVENNDA